MGTEKAIAATAGVAVEQPPSQNLYDQLLQRSGEHCPDPSGWVVLDVVEDRPRHRRRGGNPASK